MKLELRDVTCGYDKTPVIKNINFEINSAETLAILGPNGVGKSTMFKTILNLIKPLSGQISIDGEDIKDWSPKKMSRYMAYVAQAHVPSFPYQVKDIAMLGRIGQMSHLARPTKKDYEIVEQALEDVGIRHLRDHIYTEISGGERQLLMIAKALVQEPKILIMDEPTANLDYGNMVIVMNCIRTLAKKGLCVIFTTHMPDQAFMCNAKTAMLFRNDPIIFGEASRVITEKNLYKAYQTDIQILEVIDQDGCPVKICTPRFHKSQNGGYDE
ncbi:ABC transporter ATP-binding protein [Eubacterium oxidoreducens]|uniref:Iron complex transport system ATP-binding protein n=1 Tax=Eubacterium oxidoreducens TaxID=1732 RepID=A0A1G6A019_EUBOX|nr:ABC transporter ATP-binding protein [Eubacterium oxidoreducens]SDB01757.1 iron complex transport system ATP-binding protein [Eubacterium oxidoreducens]